jgi:hypothetical protein
MAPAAVVKGVMRGPGRVHRDAEHRVDSGHRVEAAVEAEHELVQVRGQVSLADAVVRALKPGVLNRPGIAGELIS